MPNSIRMPWAASIPKVMGSSRATPMVAVRPGRAPMQMPDSTPTAIYNHGNGGGNDRGDDRVLFGEPLNEDELQHKGGDDEAQERQNQQIDYQDAHSEVDPAGAGGPQLDLAIFFRRHFQSAVEQDGRTGQQNDGNDDGPQTGTGNAGAVVGRRGIPGGDGNDADACYRADGG